ncbi:hypothetical protein GCM10023216_20400 [Isoptericola chiayiensis]|uniref:Uncharacterized protein n=1 Tax=Isoptericola chiayiensis TaxID=579446 RepID=A0ABP8YH43_9MICO
MPAASKSAAVGASYAVSIVIFSPRSFARCRWWTRTRRAPRAMSGALCEDAVTDVTAAWGAS